MPSKRFSLLRRFAFAMLPLVGGWSAAPTFVSAPQDPPELGPFVGEAGTYSHQPAGATRIGTETLTKVGSEYRFKFVGDETIEYSVNMGSATVQSGRIEVREFALSGATTPATLIRNGGLTWRASSNTVESALTFSSHATTTLLSEHMNSAARRLTLRYRDVDNNSGNVGLKTYELQLVGKVLRIRASADRNVNSAYIGNYAGLRLGPTLNTVNPRQQHIPYMDSVPVVVFDQQPPTDPPTPLYFSAFIDWYKSSASDRVSHRTTTVTGPSYEFFIGPQYDQDSQGQLLSAIDETVNVLLTGKIHETYPVVLNDKSPYYDLMAGKAVFNHADGASYAWTTAKKWFEQLSSWGVDDMAGNMFNWSKWSLNLLEPDNGQAGVLGCDPGDLVAGPYWQYLPYVPFVEGVYPDDPTNQAVVKVRFQALMNAARNAGYPLSLYQGPGDMDPHGFGSILGEPDYPTNKPYTTMTSGWASTVAGWHRGLFFPTANPLYLALESRLSRDASLLPRPGWDTSLNVGTDPVQSTFAGTGHRQHFVSPTHLLAHLTDSIGGVLTDYAPSALFVDARTDLLTLSIDQQAGSPRAHTLWRSIVDERDALLQHRANIGGPLVGENSHFREGQWDSFAAGIWDGRHRKFPVEDSDCAIPGCNAGPSELLANADAWVIPDYELTQVGPLASSNAGMGWETHHKSPANTVPGTGPNCTGFFPVDCQDGTGHAFFDSWWTNIVTYGHSAHFGSNGSRINTPRTMEGFLREYYLLAGLQKAYRSSGVPVVQYELPQGGFTDLSGALQSGVDLRAPRIWITYAAGLEIYANHGSSDWVVSVTDDPPGSAPSTTVTITLPSNGFIASDAAGLLVFSGMNPNNVNKRVDYARVPGRWEMISCRGGVQTFGGFPQASLLALLPTPPAPVQYAQATVVRNDVRHIVIGASGGLWNNQALPNPTWHNPSVYGQVDTASLGIGFAQTPTLQIHAQDNVTTLAVGNRMGVTAALGLGTTSAGSPIHRDVTTFIAWQITPVGQTSASIDQNGALTAVNPGTINVQGSYTDANGTIVSNLLAITITQGTPTAAAGPDRNLTAGGTQAFDSLASTDLEGNRLAPWWSFGDGSAKKAGSQVLHTYHAPGNYVATLTLRDSDGQPAQDTAAVTVAPSGTLSGTEVWADRFGEETLDGWVWNAATSGWGVVEGWNVGEMALRQSVTTSGAQVIGIPASNWAFPTVQTKLKFVSPLLGDATNAAIHVRKTTVDGAPAANGYYCYLTPGGTVVLEVAGVVAKTKTITGFDPDDEHTLKVIVSDESPAVRIRVFVDDMVTPKISRTDSSPQPGFFVGLATENQSVLFDDLYIAVP